MIFDRENFVRIIFLELLSITPLLIILGNVVPPFPIKIHFLGFGLTFLVALYLILINPTKKWIAYFGLLFLVVQVFLDQWHIKDLIDFFFGPFVLVIAIDLVANKRIPMSLMLKYEKRYFTLMWVPVLIAVFQYFHLLPLTFWNATYVNSAIIDGVYYPRPNGFLYHGAELSVILCFTSIHLFFKKEQQSFWLLLFLILASLLTYFKAVSGCIILIFLFYITFVNRGSLSQFRIIDRKRIFAYGSLLAAVIVPFLFYYFKSVYEKTGYYFLPQLLTGRGSIWNVYIDSIKEFSFWNYLFGKGIGSPFELFQTFASPKNWWPLTVSDHLKDTYDPHNAILSIFLNTGLLGFVFMFVLYKIIYTQVSKLAPSAAWNRMVFWGMFLIPLLTIGVTIPIYEMAVLWTSLAFIFIRWNAYGNPNEPINLSET